MARVATGTGPGALRGSAVRLKGDPAGDPCTRWFGNACCLLFGAGRDRTGTRRASCGPHPGGYPHA